MDPQPFGPYTLLHRLGKGGMAEVFLARAPSAGGFAKLIAIKRLLGPFNTDDQLVSMLADEARLSVWLYHPNIVQVFDFGVVEGTHYIAMEFVDGCDLTTLIRDRRTRLGRPLPLPTAIYVMQQVTEALGYAHDRSGEDGRPLGIIHRDVSPHNVLVSREGQVKLADFGLARATISVHHSSAGVIRGKFAYMPKEQAHGRPIDHRIDIFAAGVTLYEALTGVRPYTSSNLAQQLYQLEQAVPPPSTHVSDIPPELDELTLQAISPAPAERYTSASEMAEDLRHALAQLSTPNQEAQQLAALVADRSPLSAAAQVPPGEMSDLVDVDLAEFSLIEDEVRAVRRTFAPAMERRRPAPEPAVEPAVSAPALELHSHDVVELEELPTTQQTRPPFESDRTPALAVEKLAVQLAVTRGEPADVHRKATRVIAPPEHNGEPAATSPPRATPRAFVQGAIDNSHQLKPREAPVTAPVEGPREEDEEEISAHDTLIDGGAASRRIIEEEIEGAKTIRRSPEEALAAFNKALEARAQKGPAREEPYEERTRAIRRDARTNHALALLLGAVALIGIGLAGGWLLRDKVRGHRTTPRVDLRLPNPLRTPPQSMPASAPLPPMTPATAPAASRRAPHEPRVESLEPKSPATAPVAAPTRPPVRRAVARPRGKAPPKKRPRPPGLRRPAARGTVLVVKSEVPAQIFVDDRLVGTTPLSLALPPGVYRVKALRIGEKSYTPTRFVTLERGDRSVLAF